MSRLKLAIFVLFTCIGCGTKNIHLTDANRTAIPEFSIAKEVELDSGFFFKNQALFDADYNASTGSIMPCLNNIDFTVMKSVCLSKIAEARNAYNPPESIEFEVVKLDTYQKEHNIDIKAIVSTEFTQRIQQLDRFNNKINENAKAQFKIAILKYGLDELFETPGLFSPILWVEATLTDENGNLLWQQTESVDDSVVPNFNYADYYAQPENFITAWQAAAKVVVDKLILEMD